MQWIIDSNKYFTSFLEMKQIVKYSLEKLTSFCDAKNRQFWNSFQKKQFSFFRNTFNGSVKTCMQSFRLSVLKYWRGDRRNFKDFQLMKNLFKSLIDFISLLVSKKISFFPKLFFQENKCQTFKCSISVFFIINKS